MRRLRFIELCVAALVIAAGYSLAAGIAAALPSAGMSPAARLVAPILRPVAHQRNNWHWQGGWWRHGPWATHGFHGAVVVQPWPSIVFVPWGVERLRYCAGRYRSFDPATGTYVTRRGVRRICH